MSFSKEVKIELIRQETAECCALAELSAILRTAGSVAISHGGLHIEVSTETPELKERVDTLVNMLYGQKALMLPAEANIGKQIFSFSISKSVSEEILTDCGIMGYDNENGAVFLEGIDNYLFLGECCKRAYIRGAYLGSGSLNVPSGNNAGGFSLEIAHQSRKFIDDLALLMEEFEIKAGTVARNSRYALYIKKKESICDFLALTGACSSVLRIMDVMIMRELRGNANRSANCIGANIAKSIAAGVRQAEIFCKMRDDGMLEELPPKLREAALMRIENPEMPLEQLADGLGISKSGAKHRLDKLMNMPVNTEAEKC